MNVIAALPSFASHIEKFLSSQGRAKSKTPFVTNNVFDRGKNLPQSPAKLMKFSEKQPKN